MSEAIVSVVKMRHLHLFKLVQTSHPWEIYLLEGSRPEVLAMLQAFYSRSEMGIEARLRELIANEEKVRRTNLARLNQPARAKLTQLIGHGDGTEDSLDGLDAETRQAIEETLNLIGTDLLADDEHVTDERADKFMERVYVGYGHKSVADCGTVVLIMEGIPMHVATAVEDCAVASYQERSTRYGDMRSGHLWNPLGSELGQTILEDWRAFYATVQDEMAQTLLEAYPLRVTFERAPTEGEWTRHINAIKARAFDIARGFIPVGSSTSVTWTTNLRQGDDHTRVLCSSPDPYVRALGTDLRTLLAARYPKSYAYAGRPETAIWLETAQRLVVASTLGMSRAEVELFRTRINDEQFKKELALLAERPARADIYRHLRNFMYAYVRGDLDFASFRDLHRHRSCDIPVPLIDGTRDLHRWYLDALTPSLRERAEALITLQQQRLRQLEGDPFLKQGYAAMGTVVPVELHAPLGSLVYVLELRSPLDVHPTLRQLTHEIADRIVAQLPELRMTVNREPDRLNLRRGQQTIFERATGTNL